MLNVSTVTATVPPKAASPASGAAPAGEFARVLLGGGDAARTAGLPPKKQAPDHPAAASPGPARPEKAEDRQDLAASGNDLPDDTAPKDDDDAAADPSASLLGLLGLSAIPLGATAPDDSAPVVAPANAAPAPAGSALAGLALAAPALAGPLPDGPVPDGAATPPTTPAIDSTPSQDPSVSTIEGAAADLAQALARSDRFGGAAGSHGQRGAAPALTDATPPAATPTVQGVNPNAAAVDRAVVSAVATQIAATTPGGSGIPTPANNAGKRAASILVDRAAALAGPAIGTVQPAVRAFAAAIAATSFDPQRDAGDPLAIPSADAGIDLGEPILSALSTASEAATQADASALRSIDQTPTIDTRHSKWIAGVIDHIEVLRDAADAQNTRIRLLPDALGKIDVALHRQGDAVSVRFTADQRETRQLLIDAQPRLTELAAARGIRISQSSVDHGSAGGQPQQQRQPEPARPSITNRRTGEPARTEDQDAADDAGWIA